MEKPWLKFYEPNIPETLDIPEIPLFQLLEDSAKDFPDNTLGIFLGQEKTYKQVQEEVDRLANALNKLGIKQGDVVALMLGNMPQFITAFFGTLKAGAILTLINPLYQAPEIQFQLNDSGAKALIIIDIMHDNYARIRDNTKVKHTVVTTMADAFPGMQVSFTPPEGVKGYHMWGEILAAAEPKAPKVSIKPKETPAVLLYTGGTTGVPKGAILTHYNLVANAHQCRSWIPFAERGAGDTTLAVLPFFHSFGLTVCMLNTIVLADRLVLHPRPDLDQVLRDIPRYNVAFFPGVPTLYASLLQRDDLDQYDLKSMTACLSGAAPLPMAVAKAFEEIAGANLVEGYGLTEASPVTHSNPIQENPPFDKKREGSVGVPMPSTLAKIIDLDSGEDLPPGQVGELVIKGPQIMTGYWNKPEETAQQLTEDGWLRTGDIARMDEDGYFYIVDRAKQMIDRAGFKVWPRDVEEVLFEHPKIVEAAVFGIPDEQRGETVMAVVVLKEGEEATAEEIIEYTKDKLAYYKRPQFVEFRDELPKSMVGKVLRRVLQEEQLEKIGKKSIVDRK
ncbi:MAG: long-chain fatty acid--CoA ligase [Candidatus Thorarchaeota archaeon]